MFIMRTTRDTARRHFSEAQIPGLHHVDDPARHVGRSRLGFGRPCRANLSQSNSNSLCRTIPLTTDH
jgi:hypothetical protein